MATTASFSFLLVAAAAIMMMICTRIPPSSAEMSRPLQNCTEKYVEITKLYVAPDPVKLDRSIKVTIGVKTTDAYSGGAAGYFLAFDIKMTGYNLILQSRPVPLCDGGFYRPCPTGPNEEFFAYIQEGFTREVASGGSATLKVWIQDRAENRLACIFSEIAVTSN